MAKKQAKKKSANGEGSLRQRKNGTYELIVMTGKDSNGKRLYKSFYGETPEAVRKALADYNYEKSNGIIIESGKGPAENFV